MDHKAFDDRIRDKLSGLNPKFNPDNWDEMADMLQYTSLKPWYIRWQKAIWGSGLLLFSLLNFYLLWQIKSERSTINNLQGETRQNVVVIDTVKVIDTVFITKTVYSENLASADLQSSGSTEKSPYLFGLLASLNKRSPLHPSWLNPSNVSHPFPNDNSGPEKQSAVPLIEYDATNPEEWLEDCADRFEIAGTRLGRKKQRRKYRTNPFEARVGLTAGLLVPNPDIGERYISQKVGLVGEFSLKKNLRFVTGGHFNKFTYKLDEVDDNNFKPEDLTRYPGYDELGKIPDEIVIENEIIQVPLHLRLYKDLNYHWSVFVSGGPTIDFLLNQSFKYKYLEISNDQLVELNEVTQEKDLRIYLGNFTGAVGIEHKFSRRLAGQMNVDYQYGLSRLGVERRSVNSLSLNLAAFYKLN